MRFLVLCLCLAFAAGPALTITSAEAGPCDPNLQRC